MERGVVVLAPPWPRSGSSNIIAAQTVAHARRGARVFLLLAPISRGHRHSKRAFWRDTVSAMTSPGVETVDYPRRGSARLQSYLDWIRAGRDDAIAIAARYAALGRLPNALTAFLRSASIEVIHANHVFSMRLAQRIAATVRDMRGRCPPIILDTHDIQSQVFAAGRRVNKHSGRPDGYESLLGTELALSRQAETLVHITQADYDFFVQRVPDRRHELILPTLHPCSEAELVERRGAHRLPDLDFIFVGNEHEANLETVRWLLREVLPLTGAVVRERTRIVGTIGDLLRRREPELYGRYAQLFVGEVPSLVDFYTATRAVLAPAVAGTGTSIKLIEAMCIGKPILTTRLGLRGLPAGESTGPGILVHESARDLADAMQRISASSPSGPSASLPNADLYDRLFSNKRYFDALADVVDRTTRSPRAARSRPRS